MDQNRVRLLEVIRDVVGCLQHLVANLQPT